MAVKWFAASAGVYALAGVFALLMGHPVVGLLLGVGSLLYGCLTVAECVLLRRVDGKVV